MTSLSSHKGNVGQRFFRISVVGFEGASRMAIEKLIRELDDWLMSPVEVADCVVINADQGALPLASVAQAYHSLYGQRCLLVSSQIQATSEQDFQVPVLARPFNHSQLQVAIESVLQDLSPPLDHDFVSHKQQSEAAYQAYISRREASEEAMSAFRATKAQEEQSTDALKAKLRKSRQGRDRYLQTMAAEPIEPSIESSIVPDVNGRAPKISTETASDQGEPSNTPTPLLSRRPSEPLTSYFGEPQPEPDEPQPDELSEPRVEKAADVITQAVEPIFEPTLELIAEPKPAVEPEPIAEDKKATEVAKASEMQKAEPEQLSPKEEVVEELVADKAPEPQLLAEPQPITEPADKPSKAAELATDSAVLPEDEAPKAIALDEPLSSAPVASSKLASTLAPEASMATEPAAAVGVPLAKVAKTPDAIEPSKPVKQAKPAKLNKIAKQRSNKSAAKPTESKQGRLQLLTSEVDIYRCCGNLPDINFGDPDERRRVYFDVEGALLNWLPMAVKQGQSKGLPTEIIGLHNGLVYQPNTDTFYCEFGEDLLLQYALSRFTFGELSLTENDHWSELVVGEQGKTFVGRADAIIWKVALWTSRGRLAYGLDLERAYRLDKMPDFTRLICFPYAQQIAELWLNKAFTIVDVVSILRVPQRYVFAFVVAAHAVGLLKA
ncbi:MAG: hypothetical protein ACPGMR_13415 [Pontibacterium sp.]